MKNKDKLELLLAGVKQQEREAIANRDVNTCEECIVREKELKQLIKLFDIITEVAEDECFVWRLEIKDKISFRLADDFIDKEITYAGGNTWQYKVSDNMEDTEKISVLNLEQLIEKITLENDYSW